MGTAEMLFPVGVTDIAEVPYPLFYAIRRAMLYLSWEEMPLKDQPPKHIWLDDNKLKAHFDRLKQEQDAGSKPGVEGPIKDPVDNDLKMIVE